MEKNKEKVIKLDLGGVKDLTTGQFLDGYELLIPLKLCNKFLKLKSCVSNKRNKKRKK